MIQDPPSLPCPVCVQHWELCTGLYALGGCVPAAAVSLSICLCLFFKVIQGVGLVGSSGRINHLAESDAQTPRLPAP